MEWLPCDGHDVVAVDEVIYRMTKSVGERETVIVLAAHCGGTAEKVQRSRTRFGNRADPRVGKSNEEQRSAKRHYHGARGDAERPQAQRLRSVARHLDGGWKGGGGAGGVTLGVGSLERLVGRFRSMGIHRNGARRNRLVATANGKRSINVEKRRTLDDGSRQARTNVKTARNQRAARTSPSPNQSHPCHNGGRQSLPLKIMLKRVSATNGRKQRSNAISPGSRRRLRATCLVFIHGRRAETPNDRKLSVLVRAVRCSA